MSLFCKHSSSKEVCKPVGTELWNMSLPWPEKLGDVSGTLDNFSTGDADKWSAAPFNEQISDLEDDLLCRHNGINDNVCSKAASDVRLTDVEENNAGNRNLD